MLITFYHAGNSVRANSLMPTDIPGQYRIETFFPSTQLLETIRLSQVVTGADGRKKTLLAVYDLLDWEVSKTNSLCNIALEVAEISTPRGEFFKEYPTTINNQSGIIKVLDTFVPHSIWIDKAERTAHLLRGGNVVDGEFVNSPLMPLESIAQFSSMKDIEDFKGTFFNHKNDLYRHLGHLKVLFIEGRYGGALPKISKTFLRERELIEQLR